MAAIQSGDFFKLRDFLKATANLEDVWINGSVYTPLFTSYAEMEGYVSLCNVWRCEHCKEEFPVFIGETPMYCPHCGAKMEE